jgi:hypothetical protein
MELLCLKSDHKYLHITSDTFELTSMSKASVYAVSESDTVKTLFYKFKGELKDLHVVKLKITEEIADL